MTPSPDAVRIRRLDAAEAEARGDALADVLVDAVAHGASVNFMAGFAREGGRAFWRAQGPGIAAGTTRLLVAEDGGALKGTVLVFFAHQPNAPHRAEVGKMLVVSTARRQGLGRRLLAAAEDEARAAGRTLLLLDTESGSAGDLLYRRCGWIPIGGVPDHAFRPDGRLAETTMFYKSLAPRPPGAQAGRAESRSAGRTDAGAAETATPGGCLCGGVRFTIRGPLRAVTTCHCGMCRRSGTSVGAYTACAPGDLEVTGRELRWFHASPIARRGFCASCGSPLFWAPRDGAHVSVSAGSLDDPSALVWGEHIFVETEAGA